MRSQGHGKREESTGSLQQEQRQQQTQKRPGHGQGKRGLTVEAEEQVRRPGTGSSGEIWQAGRRRENRLPVMQEERGAKGESVGQLVRERGRLPRGEALEAA